MEFKSYGKEDGKLVIYFHGAPGATHEAEFLRDAATQHNLNILCFNRFSVDSEIVGNAYYLLLADTIKKHIETHDSNPKKVDIIGFSIGCHVALEVSIFLAEKMGSLHLISAAAPLEAGDFLDQMAAKPVFKLAQNVPLLFKLLTNWQGLLVRATPGLLFNMIFASAQGNDKKLVTDPAFKQLLAGILGICFKQTMSGYIKDVLQYVQPWSPRVALCLVDTYLWHGEQDNWSPVAMAHYLESALPSCQGKHIEPDASHYSCLITVAPLVCACIAQD
jgi:pimeloyl-ACP methyl ester carboxylesterase